MGWQNLTYELPLVFGIFIALLEVEQTNNYRFFFLVVLSLIASMFVANKQIIERLRKLSKAILTDSSQAREIGLRDELRKCCVLREPRRFQITICIIADRCQKRVSRMHKTRLQFVG